jgi:beta-lactamase superfamily II metal-dependent hydrolase
VAIGASYLAVLDVGHGNAAVLVDDSGVVVIDTGSKTALLEYLREQGIRRLDVVLISHADSDHIGGLIGLLATRHFQIGRVRINTDSAKGSKLWDDLAYELDRMHRGSELDFQPNLTSDVTGQFDQGAVRIEILGPSKYLATKGPGSVDVEGRRITTNSASAVVRLVLNGEPFVLLCGDVDDVGLADLERTGVSLQAKVLVFPHHGGRAGGSNAVRVAEKLMDLASPSTVVFSIGRGIHGTPRPEIVEAITRRAPVARIICTQLSEHCASAVPTKAPGHLNPHFAQGRTQRVCCAGTILIPLAATPEVLPRMDEHRAFITIAAPTALCRP